MRSATESITILIFFRLTFPKRYGNDSFGMKREKRKNPMAVALGRRGGEAGKGSEKRKAAAILANKVRWAGHVKKAKKNKSKKILA